MGSAFKALLEEFAGHYRLSPREHDVMIALANGTTRLQALAERLGLSQNTLHNHLRRIFRKTSTNGKAELLALVLRHSLTRAGDRPLSRKHPKVLIVDDDRSLGEALRRSLERRGLQVTYEIVPREVLSRLNDRAADVVVLDVEMPEMSGLELVRRIRRAHGEHPALFVMTGDPAMTAENCIEQGAQAFFRKPLDVDALAFRIFEHFVESPYEHSRFLRVEAAVPVRLNGEWELSTGDIGYGGAYIPLLSQQLAVTRDFEVGQRVHLEIHLEEDRRALQVEGEVAWRRTARQPADRAGIGVRFVGLPDSSQASIEAFVRRRKLVSLTSERRASVRMTA